MTDSLLPALADPLSADEVAAYLQRHPDFLCDYPDLAAQLHPPHGQGAVASLAAYQLQSLRRKNAELEQRLSNLVAVAADNERLMQRVHALTIAVLRAAAPAGAMQSVVTRLSEDFQIEHVRLVLFGPSKLPPAHWLIRMPEHSANMLPFADLMLKNEPFVGRLSAERLGRLFGDQAPQVCSSAVMPLPPLGLLAIGSNNPDRFQPGLGALFLQMIAATVVAVLHRAQESP